jgi:hypothetical protein
VKPEAVEGIIPPAESPSPHEEGKINAPVILRVALVLSITLVVCILLLLIFFQELERKYPRRTSEADPLVTASDLPPLPRLQMHPLRNLQAVRDLEDSHLNNYRWIDPDHGTAQIPVERAMVLWVKSYSAPMPEHKASEESHAP